MQAKTVKTTLLSNTVPNFAANHRLNPEKLAYLSSVFEILGELNMKKY